VDTPILPNETDDARPPVTSGRSPVANAFAIAAAGLALVGSVLGLLSRLEPGGRQRSVSELIGLDRRTIIYGERIVNPRLHDGGVSTAGVWCTDEIRYEPTAGAWHCAGAAELDGHEVGHLARDPGGPCTHRLAGAGVDTWICVAQLEIPQVARDNADRNGFVTFGAPLRGSHVCVQAERSSATEGAWHCSQWRPLQPGYRTVAPIMQPGPCLVRVADQRTGQWSCNMPYSAIFGS
jgi:hypothetical protein